MYPFLIKDSYYVNAQICKFMIYDFWHIMFNFKFPTYI